MKTKSICVSLLLGLFLCCVVPGSFAEEIAAVQQAIRDQGLQWVAGETSMTRLTPAERKMRLGVLPPRSAPQAPVLFFQPPEGIAALPTKLDWRNNGGDYVTSVKDQGACGSCWAFGVAAALESHVLIRDKLPGQELDLSEQVLVSCGLECSEWLGGCQGGWIHIAAEFAREKGLPLESCYRYTATDGTCSRACSNWQANAYRMVDWNWVTPPERMSNVDALKAALYRYGPLTVAFAVYSDFYSYKYGIYSRTAGSWFEGYHAVQLVGYDDSSRSFIVKNSWATNWGWMGYVNMSYDTVTDCRGDLTDPNNTSPGVCFGFEAIAFSATPFEGKATSVNSSCYAGLELATESIASAFGAGLATTTEAATTLPLPTTLGGTTVRVTDSKKVSRLAPLFYVSPGQVNYQIPAGTAPGMAEVVVTSGDGKVSSGTPHIAARVNSDYEVLGPSVAPGLFSANADGKGVAAANVLRVKGDETQVYEPVAQWDDAQKRFVPVPIELGPETDQVFLLLYGTGIRWVTALSKATVKIGGVAAEVTYAGAQGGYVGLDQVNVKLPRTLVGRGEVDVELTVEGKPANVLRVNIR